MNHIKKALITAAGWGTRFLPATKSQPKEMLPLFNKPLIQFAVEDAAACGIETIVIVTALGKRALEDHFDRSVELERVLLQKGESALAQQMRRLADVADICFVRQKEQLGLGHAVLCAKNVIGDEPFALLLPDDVFEQGTLVLQEMMKVHEHFNGSVIALAEVPQEQVIRYGIVASNRVSDRLSEVHGLVEKPSREDAPSNLAVMGRYILTPGIFEVLEHVQAAKDGEIQLTDGLRELLRTQPIYGYQFEGHRYDGGTPLGLLEASVALALKDKDIAKDLRDYLVNLLAEDGSRFPPI